MQQLARLTALAGCILVALVRSADSPSGAATVEELQSRIGEHIGEASFSPAWWGLQVVSLDTGMVLFETNAAKLFRPASNAKLFTGALAIHRLGPEYRIRTPLLAASRPSQSGTVRGDVVLVGRGDFSWAARFHGGDYAKSLSPVLAAFRQAGIRRVRGDLVGDVACFRGPPLGASWTWDDLQFYYGAEVSPLTHEDNVVDLRLQPGGTPGQPCRILTQPATDFLGFVNRSRTVPLGARRSIQVERPLGANQVFVTGQLPAGGSNWVDAVTVHDPARWFLTRLKTELGRDGVRVSGGVQVRGQWSAGAVALAPTNLVKLGEIESPPMSELVRQMMKPSQNLYAQLLLLQVGMAEEDGGRRTEDGGQRTEDGGQRTEELGVAALRDFAREVGIAGGEVRLDEGSGLSRNALVTPRAIVALLRFMDGHRDAATYRASLPIAGVDGTLRNRMKGTAAAGNVQAKTGTLSGVYTLSGYVTTAAGERLAFSVMLNGYFGGGSAQARSAVDALAILLAEFRGRSAGAGTGNFVRPLREVTLYSPETLVSGSSSGTGFSRPQASQ